MQEGGGAGKGRIEGRKCPSTPASQQSQPPEHPEHPYETLPQDTLTSKSQEGGQVLG